MWQLTLHPGCAGCVGRSKKAVSINELDMKDTRASALSDARRRRMDALPIDGRRPLEHSL